MAKTKRSKETIEITVRRRAIIRIDGKVRESRQLGRDFSERTARIKFKRDMTLKEGTRVNPLVKVNEYTRESEKFDTFQPKAVVRITKADPSASKDDGKKKFMYQIALMTRIPTAAGGYKSEFIYGRSNFVEVGDDIDSARETAIKRAIGQYNKMTGRDYDEVKEGMNAFQGKIIESVVFYRRR